MTRPAYADADADADAYAYAYVYAYVYDYIYAYAYACAYAYAPGDNWLFYDTSLASATVVNLPQLAAACPPTAVVGVRYRINNAYQAPRVSWAWCGALTWHAPPGSYILE
jgi:hypothetical protein